MSALGFLYEILPRKNKKEIRNRINAFFKIQSKIINEILDSLYADSTTGWNKLHSKVKNETLKQHEKNKKNIRYRRIIKLNRWWYNEL